MSFFAVELVVLGTLFVGMMVFGVWVHRLDRDDFDQGQPARGMSDSMRRLLQLGIGLSSSGSNIGGR